MKSNLRKIITSSQEVAFLNIKTKLKYLKYISLWLLYNNEFITRSWTGTIFGINKLIHVLLLSAGYDFLFCQRELKRSSRNSSRTYYCFSSANNSSHRVVLPRSPLDARVVGYVGHVAVLMDRIRAPDGRSVRAYAVLTHRRGTPGGRCVRSNAVLMY